MVPAVHGRFGFLLASMMAALALAGCSEVPGPEPAASENPDPTMPLPTTTGETFTPPAPANLGPTLELRDCTNFGGVFPVPMDAARAALPNGFEPVPTPSDPAGGATLYVLGLRCTGSSVDGRDTGAADLAYAELAVIPPEPFAVEGLVDATVPIFFGGPPGPVGDALAALRLGISGPAGIAWDDLTPAAGIAVSAELGPASFSLGGEVLPSPAQSLGSGDFVLYGVQDGTVQTVVRGSAEGGEAAEATILLEPEGGLPLLEEARPVVRGFSVTGFSLTLVRLA